MRSVIAILIVAAAGYFLYAHPEVWNKYSPWAAKPPPPAAFSQKESFAVKMITRVADKPYEVAVILIDGNRWRTETKEQGSSKINVAVCDGNKTVAVPPMGLTVMMDPRLKFNQLLLGAAFIADAQEDKGDVETEQRDGHNCWKSSAMMGGLQGEVWVDSVSGFPVGSEVSFNGKHLESHILQLEGDLSQHAAEYFDTSHTDPLLGDELEDDLNKSLIDHFTKDTPTPAPGQAVSTPAPVAGAGMQSRYVLKAAVTITTAYGEVTIPANTEVHILGQTASGYHVSGGGAEFDVRGEQITSGE